jgi:outer membrane protein assembly factor BamE
MRIRFILLAAVLLAGCAPYKMDVRQGNFITPETRERLKVGMTRNQVRVLMGTPLVADPFHPDRWDYVYSLEHAREQVASQRMTLYFQGEKLARIDEAAGQPTAVSGGKKP